MWSTASQPVFNFRPSEGFKLAELYSLPDYAATSSLSV